MKINCTIQLWEGDVMQETPSEIADGVLRAVGGDEAVDYCEVVILQPLPPMGTAGVPTEP